MKKLCVFSLCLALIICSPCTVFAKNFDTPPDSIDEINHGDTYGKGDGEVKVFDEKGNLISKHRMNDIGILGPVYDNGTVSGSTDIWWYYNVFNPITGSGPKCKGTTFSYANDEESDLVEATTRIKVSNVVKATEYEHVHDDNYVEAYVEHLYYTLAEGPILTCVGETEHRVYDSDEGWDIEFDTDDSF